MMLLWSIEPKIDWNQLLPTIEAKNLVPIVNVSNSEFEKCLHVCTHLKLFDTVVVLDDGAWQQHVRILLPALPLAAPRRPAP